MCNKKCFTCRKYRLVENNEYRQTSNKSRILADDKIFDAFGASSVGAVSTTPSFSN